MKNPKLFSVLKSLLVFLILLVGHVVYAENESINFTIKNDGAVIFSDGIPLPADVMVNINDSDGNPQSVNARSVLNIVKNADDMSSGFNISSLIYYSSFSAFYLKCIDVSGAGELCDTWLYKVNDESPDSGMDQNILSGGEDVVLFFGSEEGEEEEIPVEEIAEVEAPESHNSSGSRSGRQAVDIEDVGILEDDEQILPEVVEEISKPEVQPTLAQDKVVEKKVVPVKKVVPIKKPVVQNQALALSAINPVTQDEPKQMSWLGKLWSWLFGN